MDETTVWERVENALDVLRNRDISLLEKDANERSISHKLATYLQRNFEEWNVDSEYNRVDGGSIRRIKKLENIGNVRPDIIVHRRGEQENLLVIEIKKSINRDSGVLDRKKLRAYKEQLRYQYALFLRIFTGNDLARGEQWYEKEFI